MARVLVTGATGFIGGALVKVLRDRGHCVVAMTSAAGLVLPDGVDRWVTPRLPTLADDVLQRLTGIEVVVHAAARAHVLDESAADPVAAFRLANTEGTLALAQACVRAGVRRFVFLSSIGVNGSTSGTSVFRPDDLPHPDSPYAQSKWEAEQGLDALVAGCDNPGGMTVHHVRPPLVYGAGARGNFALLVRLVRTGLPLPLGALRAPRSFVALDNLVDLLARLVEHPAPPSGVYLVADAERTTTADFIRAIAKAMGQADRLLMVPAWLVSAAASLVGRADQIRKMAVPLAVDTTETSRNLDWQPPRTMDQALARTFAGSNRGENS
jgi:nucleoside-diphosphate-sugar epimerase